MTRASGAGSALGLESWVVGLGSWFGREAQEYVTTGNGPAVTSLSSVLDPRKNKILDVTSKWFVTGYVGLRVSDYVAAMLLFVQPYCRCLNDSGFWFPPSWLRVTTFGTVSLRWRHVFCGWLPIPTKYKTLTRKNIKNWRMKYVIFGSKRQHKLSQ